MLRLLLQLRHNDFFVPPLLGCHICITNVPTLAERTAIEAKVRRTLHKRRSIREPWERGGRQGRV
jgi:hypothetical protein